MRRHIVPISQTDFDTRAMLLTMEIKDEWEESVKAAHHENRHGIEEGIRQEFGGREGERKVADFSAAGHIPLSIIAYHNALYRQIRDSFVLGSYYPALTGACALGERILNHLILDLRDDFRASPEYKRVYGKDSFNDWSKAVEILESWNVLAPGVAEAIRKLGRIRNRSLHFDAATYSRLREDALDALRYLATTISEQFDAGGKALWFIRGTRGAFFIKKDEESNPFLKRYYLRASPRVGPYYAYALGERGWQLFDFVKYGNEDEVSDEEFKKLFNDRQPHQLAPTRVPPAPGVISYEWG